VIHSSAIIHRDAKISNKVEIGPYCVIGAGVKIDENTKIHFSCKYNWKYNNRKKQ
jgi:Acyl-[acyl carrier protein]--UDP-N-acetylglucosamine O-acyltransferase